ncbi:HAD hydrolase family protein [Sporolactobacillus sp. Y61]|uniref:HAD hydrolase family protein n=2 Tax=unclassified Sporolactobacillus TaxID=2628533 RepID=A0AAU8IFQ2_9BACL
MWCCSNNLFLLNRSCLIFKSGFPFFQMYQCYNKMKKGGIVMNPDQRICAFVFDLDGTLLNSRKEISERTQNALLRCAQTGKHLFIISREHS